jgi:ethanolamine ammonia-lyase small subunit
LTRQSILFKEALFPMDARVVSAFTRVFRRAMPGHDESSMSSDHQPPAHTTPPPQDEPWAELRALTAARIALPRAGASLATAPQLDLRLAHARARDAVHAQLDEARLVAELAPLGLPVLAVASAAGDRTHYLMRPDLGRRLAGNAEARLAAHAGSGHDVAIVIADGLSARAVEMHARPLLAAALPRLKDWRIAPLVVVRQAASRSATKSRARCAPISRSC